MSGKFNSGLCFGKTKKITRQHKKSNNYRYFRKDKAPRYNGNISLIEKLKSEIEILTSCGTDTIYSFNYNNMRYEYVSPSVIKLTGYSSEELKKNGLQPLILKAKVLSNNLDLFEHWSEIDSRRIINAGQKWQADYLLKSKDNRTIWVSDVAYPSFDQQGKIVGCVGCLRDVSDRIEAENVSKEELVKLAHTDTLTHLANRRKFFNFIENELKRIQRNKSDLSILLLDIDFFKKINDQYGHSVGDQILIEIAQKIKSCLRETDLAARLGGEEFGVFLPDTPINGAYWVAERICNLIAKQKFFIGEKMAPITCTVSIGIASTSTYKNVTAAQLYKEADARLYVAKNTGRNQVSADEFFVMH
jgi:diguanylate cyclase (GGDEF)-like protein/PAS domain S-box-containing protein